MPRFMTQRDIRDMIQDGELERDLREEGEMGEDFTFTPDSFHPQCGHICRECGMSEEEGCDRDCPINGETDYIDPEYDLLDDSQEEEWEEEGDEVTGNEGYVTIDGAVKPDRMYRGA